MTKLTLNDFLAKLSLAADKARQAQPPATLWVAVTDVDSPEQKRLYAGAAEQWMREHATDLMAELEDLPGLQVAASFETVEHFRARVSDVKPGALDTTLPEPNCPICRFVFASDADAQMHQQVSHGG